MTTPSNGFNSLISNILQKHHRSLVDFTVKLILSDLIEFICVSGAIGLSNARKKEIRDDFIKQMEKFSEELDRKHGGKV